MSGPWVRRDIAFVQQNLTYGFQVCCYWLRTQKVKKKKAWAEMAAQPFSYAQSFILSDSSLRHIKSVNPRSLCTFLIRQSEKSWHFSRFFAASRSIFLIRWRWEGRQMTSKSLTLSRLLAIGRQQGNLKVPEMKYFVLSFHIQHMNKPFLLLKYITATKLTAFLELMFNWNNRAQMTQTM